MNNITIITSDNVSMSVPASLVKFSETLRGMLEDIDSTDFSIPLPNINSTVLQKIVMWCEHHSEDVFEEEPPIVHNEERKTKSIKDQWDADFLVNETNVQLMELVNGTNYLDIKPLYYLGCYQFSLRIRKTALKCQTSDDDSRATFFAEFSDIGITDDLTAEQKAKLETEDDWRYPKKKTVIA